MVSVMQRFLYQFSLSPLGTPGTMAPVLCGQYEEKMALSSRLRELKNRRKDQLGNPKSGRGQGGGRLRELFITKSESQSK